MHGRRASVRITCESEPMNNTLIKGLQLLEYRLEGARPSGVGER